MSLEGKAESSGVLRGKINNCDVLTLSAYGIAVKNGFKGTEEEWLESLKPDGGYHAAQHAKGGKDVITPEMIGARPDTWMPSATDVGASPMEYTKKVGNPHNLLDNSDFRNPVNQRGITSGTHSTGYKFDRWAFFNGAELAIAGNSHISLRPTGEYVDLWQNLEEYATLNGKTFTFAAKIHYLGESKTVVAEFAMCQEGLGINLTADGRIKLYSINSRNVNIRIAAECGFEWVALYEGEYTAETLPEYQPKGYGAELAECQRYYQVLPFKLMTATSENKVLPGREYKVPMRVVPTATIFTPAGDGYIATWGNDTAFTVEAVYTQQDSIVYVTATEQTTVGKPIGYGVKLSADL